MPLTSKKLTFMIKNPDMRKRQQSIQSIIFPLTRKEDWREALPRKIIDLQPGIVTINCLDWTLSCKDLKQIKILLERARLKIKIIESSIPETLVSASSLGYLTLLKDADNQELNNESTNPTSKPHHSDNKPCLLFHQGTLRSGENLDTEGDLLLLGDVNPGAQVTAGGNVMIWGRLRGNAHAGKSGDNTAKIIALQLRPLQLRISDKIARGPEDKPQEGLAEEALIERDRIVIKPANPTQSEKPINKLVLRN